MRGRGLDTSQPLTQPLLRLTQPLGNPPAPSLAPLAPAWPASQEGVGRAEDRARAVRQERDAVRGVQGGKGTQEEEDEREEEKEEEEGRRRRGRRRRRGGRWRSAERSEAGVCAWGAGTGWPIPAGGFLAVSRLPCWAWHGEKHPSSTLPSSALSCLGPHPPGPSSPSSAAPSLPSFPSSPSPPLPLSPSPPPALLPLLPLSPTCYTPVPGYALTS